MVKWNNGTISVLAYRKPKYIDYSYYGDFASVTEFRRVCLSEVREYCLLIYSSRFHLTITCLHVVQPLVIIFF